MIVYDDKCNVDSINGCLDNYTENVSNKLYLENSGIIIMNFGNLFIYFNTIILTKLVLSTWLF